MRDAAVASRLLNDELETALLQAAACVAGGVVFAAAVLAPVACLIASLAAATATAAVVAFRGNEVRRDFHAPLTDAWHAAVFAMNDNGFSYGDQTWRRTTAARVEGGRASIVVERHAGDVTRVRVRVGLFRSDDNRRRAALLVESVERRLAR